MLKLGVWLELYINGVMERLATIPNASPPCGVAGFEDKDERTDE